ncbi:hypothetical protein [Pedobacter sp. MW01-1-1]|uniref:hypothetical protein n=1 Tax=Pedobacter sp. MW01-1-1 TaxID=3383027 RepID=UPI003FEEE0C6
MKNTYLTFAFVMMLLFQIKAQETSSLSDNPSHLSAGNTSNLVKQDLGRDVPWFVERFKVSAGFFLALSNTNVQIGNSAGTIGSNINFEDDLGFDKQNNTFLFNAQWRISSRSRIDLSYYGLNRKANKNLSRTISIGDETYPANVDVNAFFDNSIYRVSYGYALLSKPKYELGLLLGAHIVEANVGITLNTNIGSANTATDYGFTAPLPDIGIWGGYAITDKLAFNGEFSFLSLTVNNISGRILNYNASVTYRPWNKLDVSLAYTGFDFKVDAVRDRLDGHLKWGYNGPTLSVGYSFGGKNWH